MAQKSNKAQHRTATARPDHFFRRARSVLTFRAARVLKRSAENCSHSSLDYEIESRSDFALRLSLSWSASHGFLGWRIRNLWWFRCS